MLFDCDGTLVDTHPVHQLALLATVASFGAKVTREWYEGYAETSTPETTKAALGSQRASSDEELIDHLAAVTEIAPVTALAR